MLRDLLRELKVAVRHLFHSPGFSLTAVLTLAFGIGATTAIFSLVEGVLLRPLPFPHSDRLVILVDHIHGSDIAGNIGGVTAPDVVNYTRDTRSFAALGGYDKRPGTYELSGLGDPAQVTATRMTPGVFAALDVPPLLGRLYTRQEDDQHQQVAVLSYATWQDRFHGDASIVGQKILLDRKPYVVIGIMPRNFEFPMLPGHLNRSELWIPMSFQPVELTGSSQASWAFRMVGRLKPGVSAEQAREDADRVAQETMRSYPAFMSGLRISPVIRGLHEDTVGQARPLIRTLFLAVVVVLLIACANLAGLLLVRAIRRRREIAVRLALGSTGAILLRQALLESLALSITGGVAGLALAALALSLGKSLLPETLPLLSTLGIDWAVAGFALALAIVTGVLCGVAPAFAAIRTSVNDTLKEGGRTGTSGAAHARLRSGLVIAEIAVAIVLLAASGLLLRSFEKMRQADLGYEPDHTLAAAYSLPQKEYGTQTAVDRFNREILRRVAALPGVTGAGVTSFLPANGTLGSGAFVPEGYVPPRPGAIDFATQVLVQGNFFRAMGIPLLHGRLLTEADDNPNGQLVVIVNQRLAQESWPGQNPIGKRLRVGTAEMQTPWATVVGEVASVKEGSPDADPRQQLYSPIGQAEPLFGSLANPAVDLNGNAGYIVVRTSVPPELVENELRAVIHSLDPQLPAAEIETMEQSIGGSEAPRRFNTVLISCFAAVAVLLAILGIYSVIAFTVAMRLHEMAIRMALGSERSGIVALVVSSGLKLAAAGCVIGLAGAFFASHLLRSFVFGVSTLDPLVLTLATSTVLLLAMAASLLPARRAAAINPVEALRGE
ncbi:MAG TPA: ABC transporter permease [Acidobacteriaceae bacterium]|nr:ABC transporter permease [Acidobacteriaceae bacterium]